MKIDSKTENLFFSNPPKVVTGDGFSVQVFFPFAIRYVESGRNLTIPAEPQIMERRGTSFLPRILRTLASKTWIEVTIEEPFYWDNSSDRPSTPDEVIITRIQASLNKLHLAFEIKTKDRKSKK